MIVVAVVVVVAAAAVVVVVVVVAVVYDLWTGKGTVSSVKRALRRPSLDSFGYWLAWKQQYSSAGTIR